MQGTPPFLVVHTNAAYSRLTSLDSHMVVGKPIADLLSVSDNNEEQPQGGNADASINGVPPGDQAVTVDAGRARAEDAMQAAKDISLGKLIATSGLFGHINTVQVHTKLRHQMVGSNNSSLTNSFGEDGRERRPFACRVSIAPIVSASTAMNTSGFFVSDREAEVAYHKGKRPKHHHAAAATNEQLQQDSLQRNKSLPGEASAAHKAFKPLQLVTHYVIQLQSQGVRTNEGGMESLSSNSASVEACLLGLSKDQVQRQHNAVHEEEASTSDTTTTRKPVAAIG